VIDFHPITSRFDNGTCTVSPFNKRTPAASARIPLGKIDKPGSKLVKVPTIPLYGGLITRTVCPVVKTAQSLRASEATPSGSAITTSGRVFAILSQGSAFSDASRILPDISILNAS
jgi:hypothetical protein